MLTRRTLIGLVASAPLLGLVSRPAMAAVPEVFADAGLAIRGADPVAYFTEGSPVAGTPEHALMWMGSTWLFSNADHMARFEANPQAYAPQYGGYCAFAMSRGYIASSVPEAWTIHDDKLYLNYSVGVRRQWLQDVAGNIASAEPYWPSILQQ